MLWFRVLIWGALVALGIFVIVSVFRGGLIPQPEDFAEDPRSNPTAVPAKQAGEMAHDHGSPGARSDPERLRTDAP